LVLKKKLFNFDLEVKPILEVLVGKTIEQSLLEVMEEEELAELRKQQREFEELRNAEKVEQQRLEEQERRLREEKHRRMKQAADVLRLEKETAEKLAAKAFAKSYLADLVPSVFNNLRENGYFYDPVERDLETGFMPWIENETVAELAQSHVSRLILDTLIRDVVAKRAQDYENLADYLSSLRVNDLNQSDVILQQQQQQQQSVVEVNEMSMEMGGGGGNDEQANVEANNTVNEEQNELAEQQEDN
jgi:hypothetical protein